MPEYLAPGVYIEETSFRARSIEGVSTTTTGFVGPTRYGPIDLDNEVITSMGEFARAFGDGQQLRHVSGTFHNYMWHAARAFFTEGGKRLYVARAFRRRDNAAAVGPDAWPGTLSSGAYQDGYARARLASGSPPGPSLRLRARWPGDAGNYRVRINLRLGPNLLAFDRRGVVDVARVSSLNAFDVVLIRNAGGVGVDGIYVAEYNENTQDWTFTPAAGPALTLSTFRPADNRRLCMLTLAVTAIPSRGLGSADVWDGLALDPRHATAGALDSLLYRFSSSVEDATLPRNHGRDLPVVISADPGITTGLQVLQALLDAGPAIVHSPPDPTDRPSLLARVMGAYSDTDRFVEVLLVGGNDGQLPDPAQYEGDASLTSTAKTGLRQLEDLDEISIVAAPGSTFGYGANQAAMDRGNAIISLLIAHANAMRYRIAVVDSGNGQSLSDVRSMRAQFDSSYGALYYPWVRVLDPITRVPIYLPPSGFVAGIYARNDITRAVYKAPANEVVNLSQGFEILLNKSQQDVLNPLGINCFRFFEGRGFRLWGGRTMSSDSEWKYVNLRRYFAYLEHSIDRGTQWAVFEPNGPSLWSNVRQTIEDFLLNEFFSGALLGDKPERSFFVRCDRSTMTQNDLDNGRLVCLIGVSVVKPAEFVIFRIGQWTADRK